MCFAPQERAIFHLSSGQNCSAPAALASLLFRPSGATNQWKKHSVSRLSYLFAHLDLLSSDCLFFDPLSSSLLFSSDCLFFDPLSSSLLFSSDCLFFDPPSSSLLFSSLLFSSLLLLFSYSSLTLLLLFSYSSHLCFSSVHIVGSLTSKHPSISWHVWVDIYEWCTWYMMFYPINHCATVPLCHGTMEQHQIWKLMKSSHPTGSPGLLFPLVDSSRLPFSIQQPIGRWFKYIYTGSGYDSHSHGKSPCY